MCVCTHVDSLRARALGDAMLPTLGSTPPMLFVVRSWGQATDVLRRPLRLVQAAAAAGRGWGSRCARGWGQAAAAARGWGSRCACFWGQAARRLQRLHLLQLRRHPREPTSLCCGGLPSAAAAAFAVGACACWSGSLCCWCGCPLRRSLCWCGCPLCRSLCWCGCALCRSLCWCGLRVPRIREPHAEHRVAPVAHRGRQEQVDGLTLLHRQSTNDPRTRGR